MEQRLYGATYFRQGLFGQKIQYYPDSLLLCNSFTHNSAPTRRRRKAGVGSYLPFIPAPAASLTIWAPRLFLAIFYIFFDPAQTSQVFACERHMRESALHPLRCAEAPLFPHIQVPLFPDRYALPDLAGKEC
jgi:hypothetical protein